MNRIIRYLLLLWLPWLFSSCVTMRHCPIETLQPARLTFLDVKNNIALCASPTLLSEAVMTNDGAVGVPTDSLIINILYTLKYSLEKAPGYEDAQFFIYLIMTDELPGASNFDVIIQLDGLQVKNAYYGQEYSFDVWEAYLYLNYIAKWTIHGRSGTLIDEYTSRDLLVWPSGFHSGKAAAVMDLPDVRDAWWDMGIAVAQNYVARIAPQWQTEMRSIYMVNKFPELSQRAYTAMQNDAYTRAFDMWENMLLSCRKRGQKKTKSQITYNLAVSCEFQNQLEQAIQWAQQSVNLKRKTKTVDYLNLLRERQQQQTKLDLQILPLNSDF